MSSERAYGEKCGSVLLLEEFVLGSKWLPPIPKGRNCPQSPCFQSLQERAHELSNGLRSKYQLDGKMSGTWNMVSIVTCG